MGTYVDAHCVHFGRGAHFAREKVRTAYLGIKGAHYFQKECALVIATELRFHRKSRKRFGTYVDFRYQPRSASKGVWQTPIAENAPSLALRG